MNTKNFEKQLLGISKPEISTLKHQDMLEEAMMSAKDKSVVSWWWLCIPLYVIAALLMKTLFVPGSQFISNIHNSANLKEYASILLFLVLPVVVILVNLLSIKRIYYLSGNPRSAALFPLIGTNVLMIVLSLIILIIYII